MTVVEDRGESTNHAPDPTGRHVSRTDSVGLVAAPDAFIRLFPAPAHDTASEETDPEVVIHDVAAAVAAEDRPSFDDRPWVYANMVSSLDGATAVDGVSGGLGGPADQQVFNALRAVADAIVVGSATMIEEDYRPPTDRNAAARLHRGQAARPTVVVLSRSLSIEPDHRLFSDPAARPIVATISGAPAERRNALTAVADVIDAGTNDLDLGVLLGELHRRGVRRALLEGGPTINGQFLAAGLIDEWNLTLSPKLVGGQSARPAHGPPVTTDVALERLWTHSGLLFGRWLTHR